LEKGARKGNRDQRDEVGGVFIREVFPVGAGGQGKGEEIGKLARSPDRGTPAERRGWDGKFGPQKRGREKKNYTGGTGKETYAGK